MIPPTPSNSAVIAAGSPVARVPSPGIDYADAQKQAGRYRAPARAVTRVFLAALYLGWSADALFYGKPLGISAPIFSVCVLAVLFGVSWLEGARLCLGNLWLHGALLFFSVMLFVRANLALTVLNVGICMALMALVAHYHAGGQPVRLGPLGYFLTVSSALGHACLRPVPHVGPTARALRIKKSSSRRSLGPVLRGLMLAAPVLLVFAALLASADMVFANLLGTLAGMLVLPDPFGLTGHATFIVCAAWVLAGGLLHAIRSRADRDTEFWDNAHEGSGTGALKLGFVEAATLLVLVDLLFLLFGWVQFAYLFGGEANISAAGYTYAEYARRGFFELVVVSVLTLGVMLALHYIVPRGTRAERLLFNGLCTGMVLLMFVLLASAFRRMQLYEAAYGYTELRLYVYACMIALGVSFAWQVVVVWFKPGRFAIGAFVVGLCFVAALDVLNPDAFITEQNMARYSSTQSIDLTYLAGLSDDAVPGLVAGLNRLDAPRKAYLSQVLSARMQALGSDISRQEWPSFHLSHSTAYELLGANRDSLR
jgi:hypothetical protein